MRKLSRRSITIAAALAMAGSLVAAPANAEVADSGTAAAVPKCVHTQAGKRPGWQYVDVINECNRNVRVIAKIANAQDSRCMSLRPGQKKVDRFRGDNARFIGLKAC